MLVDKNTILLKTPAYIPALFSSDTLYNRAVKNNTIQDFRADLYTLYNTLYILEAQINVTFIIIIFM